MPTEGREYFLSEGKCLKLDIPIPYQAMYEEAVNLRDQFVLYRSTDADYTHKGWHSLAIHGLSHNKPASWEAYDEFQTAHDAIDAMTWTVITDRCPITVEWLKNTFPSKRLGRVRFMLLEAGGYIDRHFDSEHHAIEPINIALNNPNECIWHWDEGTLDFSAGDIYALNLKYHHRIVNNSNIDRYHLIVHHHDSTDEWKLVMSNAAKEQGIEGHFHYSTEAY
jgi:hypothetical protein